jgi:hypothetical protein
VRRFTERKKWESSQGPSEEGDVETTKKILNNFNYAISSQWEVSWG